MDQDCQKHYSNVVSTSNQEQYSNQPSDKRRAFTEAIQSYQECIEILGARYGVDSSRVADVKGRCAWIFRILGDNETSISYLDNAIAAHKRDHHTLGCSSHEIPSRLVSPTKDLVILHRNLGIPVLIPSCYIAHVLSFDQQDLTDWRSCCKQVLDLPGTNV